MDWRLLTARMAGAFGIVVGAIVALLLALTTTFGPAEPNDPLYEQLVSVARTAPLTISTPWIDVSDKVCPMVDVAKLDRLTTLSGTVTKSTRGRPGYQLEVSLFPVQNCVYFYSRRRDLEIDQGQNGQCQATVQVQHACGP